MPQQMSGDDEVWKAVEGFPGYEVSNMGRVRSWKARNGRGTSPVPRLLNHGTLHGYPVVCLQRKPLPQSSEFVHHLVLRAFVGPPPLGAVCRHWPDRTRTNAKLSNLQWGTHAENARDREADGMTARGLRNGHYTKPERTPRGDNAPARRHPERLARGDRNGARTKPERLKRGAEHHSYRTPWVVARGEKHGARMQGVARGEKNPRARISEATARAIIAGIATGRGIAELARAFAADGATKAVVANIKHRDSWSYLPRPWAPASSRPRC